MNDEPQTDPSIDESPRGRVVSSDSGDGIEAALREAMDFRGDVRVTTTDGRVLEGYLFDRRGEGETARSRLWLKADDQKVEIADAEIAELAFSDRDPAAGKSWETWVAKFKAARAAGESASMEPERLDEDA